MGIDWQTTFYIVNIIVMFALLVFLVSIISVIFKIKSLINQGITNTMMMGSLAKLSALRVLLKILR